MNRSEINEVMNEYQQLTGKAFSSKVNGIFYKLLALCDHWENLGKEDATVGIFSPPAPIQPTTGLFYTEIVELLALYYIIGYHSAKGGRK